MEQTLPKMLRKVAADYPEIPAQYSRKDDGNFKSVTFRELFDISLDFAAGLLDIGVKRGEPVGLISDNREEWQQSDMGIMAIGAVDVPRGCDATLQDLEAILSITECKVCIAENPAQAKKILSLKEKLSHLKTIIVFDELNGAIKEEAEACSVKITCFSAVVKEGKK